MVRNTFSTEHSLLGDIVSSERVFAGSLLLCALAGTFGTLINPTGLSIRERAAYLAFGLTSSLALTVYANSKAENETVFGAINKGRLERLKQDLRNTYAEDSTIAQIETERQLAAYLNTLPVNERAWYASKYGLQALIDLPQPEPAPFTPVAEPRVAMNATASGNFSAVDWDEEAVNGVLPQVYDYAREIAEYDGHIGFVSKTRSGKTTTMIAAILYALELGHTVYLIDYKGDRRLASIPGVHYLHCNHPSKVGSLEAMMTKISDELVRRQSAHDGAPISVFIDENNVGRATIESSCDKLAQGKERTRIYDKTLERFILQGAAERVYVRASSHTSRVEDWGFNSGVLDSLSFIAQARNGSWESVEDLLQYQVKGKQKEDAEFHMDAMKQIDIAEPVMFSTMKPTGFFRLPVYEFNFVEQQPAQPAPTPEPQRPQPTTTATATAGDVYQTLRDYQVNNPQWTRAELEAKFAQLTGKRLNDAGYNALLEYLSRKA